MKNDLKDISLEELINHINKSLELKNLVDRGNVQALQILANEVLAIKNKINKVPDEYLVKQLGRIQSDRIKQNEDIVNHFSRRIWKLQETGKLPHVNLDVSKYDFTPDWAFVPLLDKLIDLLENGEIKIADES